jgi:non-heme chloroperoxidase
VKEKGSDAVALQADDDQIVPIDASAHLSSKFVLGATLKVYSGGDTGVAMTQKDQLNAILLAFIKG